jgi:periplasmic divalent cation tolerance protein
MTDKLLVLTTTGSESEARKIAQAIVERKLAACVNIVPRVHSVYRWEGRIESAEEYLLIVKTTKKAEKQVRTAIQELHSYQLPECLAIGIEGGSKEYLQWVSASVDQDQDHER